MHPTYRDAFDSAYTDDFYRDYLAALEQRLGVPIPFRVAETPFFIPRELRDRLAANARGVLDEVLRSDNVAKMKLAIPAHFDVPHMDAAPHCVQVDFAITEREDGTLDGKVVELQAFPSLYALMVIQRQVIVERMRAKMPGLDRDFSIYFGGLDEAGFVTRLREAIVADEDPEHVVLLDLHPEQQKTLPDFVATKQLLGVDSVCPTKLVREGARLYRDVGGKRVPIKRIYNRVVFDELERSEVELPFRYTDELDVRWFSHPNWYWTISKYSLPLLRHASVPQARTLRELGRAVPEDLSNYVLKPLFSFAGAGVKVDVERADLDAVPEDQRDGWLLQEKITYHPGIRMPDGNGVKAEVRMMFLRRDQDAKPELVLNLVRLSRGKMLGVDQNRDLTWVGGSVGLFEEPGA